MFETITPIDFQILGAIQDTLACPAMDTFFSFITHLGDSGLIWILITLVFLCVKRLRLIGIASGIALLFVAIFGEFGIKLLVARPRPFMADPSIELIISAPRGYSFPSIHSAFSFAAATIVCAVPALNKKHGKETSKLAWAIIIGIVILAVLIAFSRLYVQVHFPSDVLAGSLFGILCGIAALMITEHFIRKRFEK